MKFQEVGSESEHSDDDEDPSPSNDGNSEIKGLMTPSSAQTKEEDPKEHDLDGLEDK